jgi:hypothetical protein
MLVGTELRADYGFPVAKAIQNPTDEEIVMYFQRRRAQQGAEHGATQNGRFR